MSFENVAPEGSKKRKTEASTEASPLTNLPRDLNPAEDILYEWINDRGAVKDDGSFMGYARGGSKKSYEYIRTAMQAFHVYEEKKDVINNLNRLFKILYYNSEVAGPNRFIPGAAKRFAQRVCIEDRALNCENISEITYYRVNKVQWVYHLIQELFSNSVSLLCDGKGKEEKKKLKRTLYNVTCDCVIEFNQLLDDCILKTEFDKYFKIVNHFRESLLMFGQKPQDIDFFKTPFD